MLRKEPNASTIDVMISTSLFLNQYWTVVRQGQCYSRQIVVLPVTSMGELDRINMLPGMIDAAADTLHKACHAGIDLRTRAVDHVKFIPGEWGTGVVLPFGMRQPVTFDGWVAIEPQANSRRL